MSWITVIGIGEDGVDGLGAAARRLIGQAEVLAGGSRHLAMVAGGRAERLSWSAPLDASLDALAARKGKPIVVLASGEPLWFGIGTTLIERFGPHAVTVLPQVGAFSLAAARMGWALNEIATISLHGRALDLLALNLAPGAHILALTENAAAPGKIAVYLKERGWGPSRLTVLERLGSNAEKRIAGTAEDWPHPPGADLNTLAIECVAGPNALILPRTPGLPDHAFVHDGQLTKREVRAATLAALAPLPGQLLWDVGAGCGSISIEWMRATPRAHAIAIERDASRRDFIERNRAALGTPDLRVIAGDAPAALADLPAPDAVFIGGGLSVPGLVERCRAALNPGGRLVANAVTVEGEAALIALRSQQGGQLTRIAVSRAEPIGPFQGWRPLMQVTQWAYVHG